MLCSSLILVSNPGSQPATTGTACGCIAWIASMVRGIQSGLFLSHPMAVSFSAANLKGVCQRHAGSGSVGPNMALDTLKVQIIQTILLEVCAMFTWSEKLLPGHSKKEVLLEIWAKPWKSRAFSEVKATSCSSLLDTSGCYWKTDHISHIISHQEYQEKSKATKAKQTWITLPGVTGVVYWPIHDHDEYALHVLLVASQVWLEEGFALSLKSQSIEMDKQSSEIRESERPEWSAGIEAAKSHPLEPSVQGRLKHFPRTQRQPQLGGCYSLQQGKLSATMSTVFCYQWQKNVNAGVEKDAKSAVAS